MVVVSRTTASWKGLVSKLTRSAKVGVLITSFPLYQRCGLLQGSECNKLSAIVVKSLRRWPVHGADRPPAADLVNLFEFDFCQKSEMEKLKAEVERLGKKPFSLTSYMYRGSAV